jgi:hypothetical protein
VSLASDRPPEAVLACLRGSLAAADRRRTGRSPGWSSPHPVSRRTGVVVRGRLDGDGHLGVRAIHPTRSSAWSRSLSARVVAGPGGGTVVHGGFATAGWVRAFTALHAGGLAVAALVLTLGLANALAGGAAEDARPLAGGLAFVLALLTAELVLLSVSMGFSGRLEDRTIRWLEGCLRA